MNSGFSLAKHSNGKYHVWYQDENGKRQKKSTGCTKKVDAQEFLTRFIRGEVDERRKSKFISLSKFQTEYLEYSKSIHKRKTWESCRSALRVFESFVGDKQLRSIGVRDIEKFLAKKQDKSAATAKRLYLTLSSAFEKAKRWEYVDENLWREVSKPKVVEKEKPFISRVEFQSLSAVIDEEDFRDLVMVGFHTGLRLGEIRHLCFNAINFDAGMLRVKNTDEFTTKSGKERTVPLNATALAILSQRNAQAKPDDLVFSYRGKVLQESGVSRKFKKYVIEAKLNPKLNFHSLRHSFASNLALNNVGQFALQKLLGHSNSATTQRYAHLATNELQHVLDVLCVALPTRYTMKKVRDGFLLLTPTTDTNEPTVTLDSIPDADSWCLSPRVNGNILLYPKDYFDDDECF